MGLRITKSTTVKEILDSDVKVADLKKVVTAKGFEVTGNKNRENLAKAIVAGLNQSNGDSPNRSASTVSKEGTMKDTFSGEVLPVTSFPTRKNAAGETVRGTVARKNLPAWREAKAKEKAAAAKAKASDKAKADKAKAAKATADAPQEEASTD